MSLPDAALLALVLLWIGSEIVYGRRRAADRGRAHDRGTLRLLHVCIWATVGVAVWLSLVGIGGFPPRLRMPLFWTGCAAMAAGLAFRAWSIHVLARWFTVDVAIGPDHQLVRSGPYRLLRHPSYTGALLTFYGFGLALGSAWSLAALVLVVTAAFLWRIRVEEAALRGAFPDAYPAYARETKRLIPGVW